MGTTAERNLPWWGAVSDLVLSVVALWPRRAFRQVITRRLRQRIGHVEAARLIRAIERRHAHVPAWSGPGAAAVRLLMVYLHWNAAAWDVLVSAGWSRADAGALIEVVNWDLFGPLTRSLYHLTRLRHTAPSRRGALVYELLFRSLFARPFRREIISHAEGFAFDVTVCPIAQYCHDLGTPDLADHAACSLDHHMAAMWDHGLRRPTTIASGHARCCFHFVPRDQSS